MQCNVCLKTIVEKIKNIQFIAPDNKFHKIHSVCLLIPHCTFASPNPNPNHMDNKNINAKKVAE